jgi:hypothetical protein
MDGKSSGKKRLRRSLAEKLTEAQADANTSAVNPFLFAPLHFGGEDDDGIYDVYLRLRRV